MAPRYEAVAKNRGDMVIRKVDIVNWSSAVAGQFGIHSLPHVIVYNSEGKAVKSGYQESTLFDPLDGSDPGEGSGGGMSSLKVMVIGLGGAALVLFMLTKLFGPKPR